MTDWRSEAACRERTDLSWFPTAHAGRGGQSSEYRLAVAAAIEVCRTCPVMTECRAAGKDEVGIWGGVLKAPSRVFRLPAACGTTAGYRRHWRNGEPACDPCRIALQDAQRLRRDDARAAKAVNVRRMVGRAS